MMNSPAVILVAVVVGVVSVAGFAYSGFYDVSASSPHSNLVNWLLSTVSHASIERHAKGIAEPDLDEGTLVLAGVKDFNSRCVACHGAPGQEPEAVGRGLNPPAPDLAESAKEMTPAELFWVTKNGIKMTGMPAWGKTQRDDELWPVIAFLTRLPDLDSDAYQTMLASAAGMGLHSDDGPADTSSHDDVSRVGATVEHPGSASHDCSMQQEQ
jgi:mono/diheme cytochrome c family protein